MAWLRVQSNRASDGEVTKFPAVKIFFALSFAGAFVSQLNLGAAIMCVVASTW